MKGLKTILGIALATTALGGAVAFAASSKSDLIKANAATSSVKVAGSFTNWATNAIELVGTTAVGNYYVYNKEFTSTGDEFKVVVNNSDWVAANWNGVSICSGITDGGGNDHNFKVSTAGIYSIKAHTGIGDYGEKGYGVVIAKGVKVTKYAVLDGVLQGTAVGTEMFESGSTYSVPSKIYRSGYSFDGWYTNQACTTPYSSSNISSNTNLYAKYTSGTWEGTVHVDLRDSGWADAAANYAVLFMDKTTYPSEVSQWSSYVTGTVSGQHLVNIPYNIGFEPLKMTVVRYNSSYTQQQWEANQWPTLWGQTPDIDFNEMIRIGGDAGDSKNNAYGGYPKVMGGNGSWAEITKLNQVKNNGYNNTEYYSASVVLHNGDEFKIQMAPYASGDYYANYDAHDSIKSSFSGDGTNNISVSADGTYAFYFDSKDNHLYITKVEIAEADEYAQTFISEMKCSGSGSITQDHWSSLSTTYSSLSSAAKNIFLAVAEDGDEEGSFVEQAICRYDYIVKKYGTTAKPDFMGRIAAGKLHPSNSGVVQAINDNNSVIPLVVMVVSFVTVTATGAFFVIRKRKHQ